MPLIQRLFLCDKAVIFLLLLLSQQKTTAPAKADKTEDKAMTNIYRLNKLNNKDLETVAGGNLKDLIRKAGCAVGMCDQSTLIRVEYGWAESRYGNYVMLTKYRCPICGRYWYYKLREDSGTYASIDEEDYNSYWFQKNMLVI